MLWLLAHDFKSSDPEFLKEPKSFFLLYWETAIRIYVSLDMKQGFIVGLFDKGS